MHKYKILILLSIFPMVILLFTGNLFNPDRLSQAFWDLGHLFLFAAIVWALLTHKKLSNLSNIQMLTVSIFISIFLGLLIEVIQYYSGRNMALNDLFNDILGGLIGYLITRIGLYDFHSFRIKLFLISLIFAAVCISLLPVFLILKDNFSMQDKFPVIADFEVENELKRWITHDIIYFKLSPENTIKGKHSLKVDFGISNYPNVYLRYFPSNWSDYKYFNFSVYNEQSENITIDMKISDHSHKNKNFAYNDRYNKTIDLSPGWNKLKISLFDVAQSPDGRLMDLKKISGFSIFLNKPDKLITIYIDDMYLSM